jgi:hypothetical protein
VLLLWAHIGFPLLCRGTAAEALKKPHFGRIKKRLLAVTQRSLLLKRESPR